MMSSFVQQMRINSEKHGLNQQLHVMTRFPVFQGLTFGISSMQRGTMQRGTVESLEIEDTLINITWVHVSFTDILYTVYSLMCILIHMMHICTSLYAPGFFTMSIKSRQNSQVHILIPQWFPVFQCFACPKFSRRDCQVLCAAALLRQHGGCRISDLGRDVATRERHGAVAAKGEAAKTG